MVVMEEKMVLLLLERSLEEARRDSSSGLIGVGVGSSGPQPPSHPFPPAEWHPRAGSRLRGDYPK